MEKNTFLFDLDGVLMLTELETFRYYKRRLAEQGIVLPDEAFVLKAGRKSKDFFDDVFKRYNIHFDYAKLIEEKRELFNTHIEQYVTPVPNVQQTLQSLRDHGYTLAVASQNERRMVNSVLQWLNIASYFELILSVEDIEQKKPNPEIYLLAATRLNVSPNVCIVVEDSKDGIGAAKNADMYCVALFHDYMPKGNYDGADKIIKDLIELIDVTI